MMTTKNIHRLLYIEAKLILSKLIGRHDLTFNFMVGPATATRDIHDYRELAPNNLVFHTAPKKAWHATPTFAPVLFVGSAHCSVEVQAQHYIDSQSEIVVACASCPLNKEIEQREIDTTEMA